MKTQRRPSKEQAADKFVGIFPFQFDDSDGDLVEDAATAIPTMVHLIPIGQWEHDAYGPIMITYNDILEFEANFIAGIRKGVYITAGHEGYQELPAQGWVIRVESRSDGLWGDVEWNDLGKETLSDKQYKFFSPEFYRDYEDPETHQIYRNVLTGGALTKSPYFKELQAVVFSEKALRQQFDETNPDTPMDLELLLSKEISTLTDEEKAFIRANADKLSDAQKDTHAEVLAETTETTTTEETPAAETTEEAPAEETAAPEKPETPAEEAPAAPEEAPAAPAATEEAPAAPAETTPEAPAAEAAPVQASEKVMISASELATLRANAKAFAEQKVAAAVGALVFSTTNTAGKFLPKSKDKLKAFMERLSPEQTSEFTALISELPKANTFAELGAAGAAEGTAMAEVETKVKAKMSEDTKLTYAEATKLVMSENPGLEQRYDSELAPAKH